MIAFGLWNTQLDPILAPHLYPLCCATILWGGGGGGGGVIVSGEGDSISRGGGGGGGGGQYNLGYIAFTEV